MLERGFCGWSEDGDHLNVSLNVQLQAQLTFFFASETTFERPE